MKLEKSETTITFTSKELRWLKEITGYFIYNSQIVSYDPDNHWKTLEELRVLLDEI